MKQQKKRDLPTKNCIICHRPFSWRKKCEKVWDNVKCCSEKCRTNKDKGSSKFMTENKMITTKEFSARNTPLSTVDIDRIIEMAWEDRTTFEAIEVQFGLKEKEVIALMRKEMKGSSFKMWRKRTSGRSTKHNALRGIDVLRFKCSRQKAISYNKISKR